MKDRITLKALAELQLGQTVWDTEQLGFGARRRKGGVFFVFKVQRRGKADWVPLGRLGDVTLDDARKAAARERGIVALGGRPGAWRRTPTLKHFGARYLREAASATKALSYAWTERALRLHLYPALGHLRLDEITAHDVTRLKDRYATRKGAFNNARRALSMLYAKAIEWRELSADWPSPCRYVASYAMPKHERYLSQKELAGLGAALATHAQQGPAAALVVAAVRLMIFTGARRDEVRFLRWGEVGPTALHLSDTAAGPRSGLKTGAKPISLNPPAAQLLAALERRGDEDLVFESPLRPGHPVALHQAWDQIRRAAGLKDVRLHDLRHSFASVAVATGHSLYVTGALLGHRNSRTTERYAHLSADPLAAASAAVARRIQTALEAGEGEAKAKGGAS